MIAEKTCMFRVQILVLSSCKSDYRAFKSCYSSPCCNRQLDEWVFLLLQRASGKTVTLSQCSGCDQCVLNTFPVMFLYKYVHECQDRLWHSWKQALWQWKCVIDFCCYCSFIFPAINKLFETWERLLYLLSGCLTWIIPLSG